MSFGPCDVVKVAREGAPGGYVVINATDFDEAVDKLFEGESAPDHVQEPHVTTAEAASNIAPPPQAIPDAQAGWGEAARAAPQPPPVEPQAAPEAGKGKK